MATLLRVGQRVINLDQITYIDDLIITVKLWFGPEDTLLLIGDEAATLHAWLKDHATAAPVVASLISEGTRRRVAAKIVDGPQQLGLLLNEEPLSLSTTNDQTQGRQDPQPPNVARFREDEMLPESQRNHHDS